MLSRFTPLKPAPLLISALTLLPQFLMLHKPAHGLILVLLGVFLHLLAGVSRILFALFIIFINVLSLIKFHLHLHWGETTGDLASRFAVMFQSPVYEMREYLHTFIDVRDGAFLVFILILIGWAGALIFQKPRTKPPLSWQKFALLFVLLFAVQNHEPVQILKQFAHLKHRTEILIERNDFLRKNPLAASKFAGFYDKVIIIQGESANKNHLGVYGYDVATTPFLSAQFAANKLYRWRAISPSNKTGYSVPMIFTDATVANWRDNFTRSHSLLDDFNASDYTTFWLSTQGRFGRWDDAISNIALAADFPIFYNDDDTLTAVNDWALVDFFAARAQNTDKEFFVLHLLGSHFAYESRYDANNALLKPAKNVIDAYDNSVHFTDSVIQQIAAHFAQSSQKILMVYWSDHGELVNLARHGHGTILPTIKDEYEVPLLLWSSHDNPRLSALDNTLSEARGGGAPLKFRKREPFN